jgi:hypothetical protein
VPSAAAHPAPSSEAGSPSKVLPKGLHRIRHYGLLANGNQAANLARMRELLGVAIPEAEPCDTSEPGLTGAALCPMPVLWRANAHYADRLCRLYAASRRGAARRDSDRHLVRPARQLTPKYAASAAGPSSHVPAWLSRYPNGHNERRRDMHDASPEHDRRACCEPVFELCPRRLCLIAAPHRRRRKPNPHRDCGDA